MSWGYFVDSKFEAFDLDESNALESAFLDGEKSVQFVHANCCFSNMCMTIANWKYLKLCRFNCGEVDNIWLRETNILFRHVPFDTDTISTLNIAHKHGYKEFKIHQNSITTFAFDLENMIMSYNGGIFNILGSTSKDDDSNNNTSNSNDDDDFPNEYLCPISGEKMRDPVVASDGFTYDRVNIQKWMTECKTKSPMTNTPFSRLILLPNTTLKSILNQS